MVSVSFASICSCSNQTPEGVFVVVRLSAMVGQDNSNGSSRDHLRRVIKMVTVISSGPELELENRVFLVK